jgi:hypothetical protein
MGHHHPIFLFLGELKLFIYYFKELPVFKLIRYFKFRIGELINDSADELKLELNLHPFVY